MGENDDLIAKVAWLYYKQKLSQQDIGDQLALSRQKVQRLLDAARSLDIIHFYVKHPAYNILGIERDLSRAYGLRDSVVVPEVPRPEVNLRRAIANAGAAHFESIVRPSHPEFIGFGHGEIVSLAAEQFPISTGSGTVPVALIGGFGGLVAGDCNMAVRATAGKLASTYIDMPAPALVGTPEIARSFSGEPAIREVLDRGRRSSLILLTVGSVRDNPLAHSDSAFRPEDQDRLAAAGAVAEILGRFVDRNGELVADEINDRVIGLPILHLKETNKTVVCVAGGDDMLVAIRATLVGQYVDVLVTDEQTANWLLEHAPD